MCLGKVVQIKQSIYKPELFDWVVIYFKLILGGVRDTQIFDCNLQITDGQ